VKNQSLGNDLFMKKNEDLQADILDEIRREPLLKAAAVTFTSGYI
jgi:hypothetical protein